MSNIVTLDISDYTIVHGSREITILSPYNLLVETDIISLYNITNDVLYFDETIDTIEASVISITSGIVTVSDHFPELRSTDELTITIRTDICAVRTSIEGGGASSVYLISQDMDGGTAASVYLPSQVINCN